MDWIDMLIATAGAYGVAGLAVGVPAALLGAGRLSEGARGAGPGLRLMILPAAVALWPLVLGRMLFPPKEAP